MEVKPLCKTLVGSQCRNDEVNVISGRHSSGPLLYQTHDYEIKLLFPSLDWKSFFSWKTIVVSVNMAQIFVN